MGQARPLRVLPALNQLLLRVSDPPMKLVTVVCARGPENACKPFRWQGLEDWGSAGFVAVILKLCPSRDPHPPFGRSGRRRVSAVGEGRGPGRRMTFRPQAASQAQAGRLCSLAQGRDSHISSSELPITPQFPGVVLLEWNVACPPRSPQARRSGPLRGRPR